MGFGGTGLQAVGVDDLAAALVPQAAEHRPAHREADGGYRPVGEDGVDLAGVRRAEEPVAVAGAREIGGRRPARSPDGVLVPAGRVALVVVVLRLAELAPVEALVGDEEGAGRA